MRRIWLAALLPLAAACASGAEAGPSEPAAVAADSTASTAPSTSTTSTAAPTTVPPTTTTAPARQVHEQAWTPFATVGGVVLRHPSARVERVAFHESNHDGARQLEPLPTAAAPMTLESRDRPTSDRSAVDVVLDPDVEVRAVVTGRVLRSGTYTLYCDHRDDYVVTEPDSHPGWEVKVLHIDGVQVRPGDRVVAGETVLAPRPTRLPFESQVDELSASPWPHVHVEVVDPSIPDVPSPGGGC